MRSINEFEGRLNDVIHEKGVTLSETAKKIGMSVASLSQIKRNGNPGYKTIKNLGKALDVDPGDFFCTEGR